MVQPSPTSLVSGPAGHFGAQRGIRSPWSSDHLQSIVWGDLLGLDLATMTRAQAIKVPAVARARHIICGTGARIGLGEWVGERRLGPDEQAPWIAARNTMTPALHRMLWTLDDLFFSGWSCWARVNRATSPDRRALPLQLDRIDIGRWTFDGDGFVMVDGNRVRPDSVLLIPGFHEGLLNFAADSIRHAADLQKAASTAARTPAAQLALKQTGGAPMTRDAVTQLRQDWAEARAGLHGGVAYLNQSLEVQELGTFDKHLVVEGRNAAAVDIARHASLPAETIDATTEKSMTYTNSRDNDRRLHDYGLGSYLDAVAATLSQDDVCERGHSIAFDVEGWLRGAAPGDEAPNRTQTAPTPTEVLA
jgi:hypothetical protein